ncbi:MAG TPA: ABC transporter permease [Pseudonocardia sp.]|jgi:ABC-type multidrug transport system permease subunit|uniref:ABC transporter permease n=1 Tax=Pseudonocardia sp. TaxID=60912 RepID=UPI002F41ADC0
MTVLTSAARDSSVVAWRNLVTIKRNPDLLFGAVVNPIIFVLLFAYVFAGSLGGDGYRHFLVAGVFVQTVAFNSAFTTLGLTNDLTKGMIDRFRSLPMSRLAVILGRTASDLVVSAVTLVIMTLAGLVVGWRIEGGPLDAVLGYLLLLLFAFAMSWVGGWIGLLCRSVEVAQSAGLIWLFPVSFIASVFVSAQTLPGPLRAFGEWNPISAVADTTRRLFGNPIQPPGIPPATGWVAEHAGLYAVGTSLLIIAIFLPLALARYRKVAS